MEEESYLAQFSKESMLNTKKSSWNLFCLICRCFRERRPTADRGQTVSVPKIRPEQLLSSAWCGPAFS